MKFNVKNAALPLLLFFGIGINDSLMKYVEHNFLQNDESLFLTVVFMVSFVIGLVVLLRKVILKNERLSFGGLFSGLVLGSLNFGSTYFFIRSMKLFDATFFFPVVNVSIVALTSLLGVLIFHEKLSKINWADIFLAILAILLISTG